MTLLAANFEDPEHARLIYLAAGGLVLIALLVIAGTVWWWRSAAVEHPALAPLEIMGTKSWSQGDESDRRSALDSVRPAGAEPGDTSLIVPDPVDLLDADRTRPLDFDDLLESPEALEEWRTAPAARRDIRRDEPRDVTAEAPRDEPRRDDPVRRDLPRRDVPRKDAAVPNRSRVPMDPLLRQPDDY